MRLELGDHVRCSDGAEVGRLRDLVVDPGRRLLTHVVVHAERGPAGSRLVPFALVAAVSDEEVALRCTSEQLASFEEADGFVLLPLGERPEAGDGWDVGVEDDVPVAAYEPGEIGDYVGALEATVGVSYDRIPAGMVELRSDSAVQREDGHSLGHLSAVELDGDRLSHVVVAHRRLFRRREVVVPIDDVAELATDLVVLRPAAAAAG